MNKLYLFAPLIALAIFGAAYVRSARAYEARLAEAKRLEVAAKQEKAAQAAAAHEQARQAAAALIVRRQAERAEKESREERERAARRDAEQRRFAAAAEEQRLRVRLERLRRDASTTDDTLRRSETEIAELEREQAFLADYLRQADANRRSFVEMLERLEIVERQRVSVLPGSTPTHLRP